MPLQVRLVHALGDRLIELPERSYETPLVVGRADDADVPLPVMSVSRCHALLYVYEGQWIVMDGKGTGQTFVNGKAVVEPTVLASGDVVTLGTDASPPTIVIDPYGVLKSSAPQALAIGPERQMSAAPVYAAPAPRRSTPAPRSAAAPVQSPPQPTPFAPAALPDSTDGDVDWMAAPAAAAAEASSHRYYVPKRNPWSAGMISAVVFCTLGIIGIAVYVGYSRQQAADDSVKTQQAAAQQQIVRKKANNIFDEQEQQRLHEAAVAAQAARDNKRPAITSVDNAASQDPGRQTEDWKSVVAAHEDIASAPEKAIIICSDYLKQNPKSPYVADLRRYIDDALDALWWRRVGDLVDEEKTLVKNIADVNTTLASTNDPDTKKSFQDDKTQLEEKLQRVSDQLKESNYSSDDKPNILDTEKMLVIRNARDPIKYEAWKKTAEKVITQKRLQRYTW